MTIKEVEIKNFRGIDDVKFTLSPNLNVFVGVNGSGKTTVLDAVATSLSWLVNRIQRESASGRPITDSSIKNEAPFSSIEVTLDEKGQSFKWRLTKTAKGEVSADKSDLVQVTDLAAYFQALSRQNSTLPVFSYYPINRVVNSITPEHWRKDSVNILDVYDNALDGKTNYQSFFEWFRLQDDIVNEQSQSRSKWIDRNRTWVKNRTKKILNHLDEIARNESSEDEHQKEIFYPRIKDFLHGKHDFLYQEPRYLFRELSDLIRFSAFKDKRSYEFDRVFLDLEYMFHRMESVSDLRKDNLIEFNNFSSSIVEKMCRRIEDILRHEEIEDDKKQNISIIWEVLIFAILLSLWWLSDKGKKEIEKIAVRFNPAKLKGNYKRWSEESHFFINEINKIVTNDAERLTKATRNEGRELNFVTKTIENFVPGYANLRVRRYPRPHMLVDKDGIEISLDQLSDGEKNLIALVGDIARRLSIANPNSKNPLNGEGLILIDEIELHLHPSWQRLMIPQLKKAFPNCQFIITTHSPQVLSHVRHENIFLLRNDKNGFDYSKPTDSFGQTSDRILEDILGVDARPKEQKDMLHNLFVLIQNGELTEAKNIVQTLIDSIGDDPEIVKANVLIKRKELIGK